MTLLLWLVGGLITLLAIAFLAILIYCFRTAFYADRKDYDPDFCPLPDGPAYEPYHAQMRAWMEEVKALPCRELELLSHDGLRLRGRYYEYTKDAPVELMFPGYRGDARRDLCGAVQRCAALGHSALIVDQRACGRSEGHVISFGVNESRDCRAWIDLAISVLGPNVKLILCGISMGAATVLMTAGTDLPSNVVGVLADCGYSSAPAIIKKVILDMRFPAAAYPFVRLAGRLFGGFDIEKASPVSAVTACRVPVLFAHGDADDFVPCDMSRENYEACASEKTLLVIPGAGHGLCYPADQNAYIRELHAFWTKMGLYDTNPR